MVFDSSLVPSTLPVENGPRYPHVNVVKRIDAHAAPSKSTRAVVVGVVVVVIDVMVVVEVLVEVTDVMVVVSAIQSPASSEHLR